jgi:hypothetical protein
MGLRLLSPSAAVWLTLASAAHAVVVVPPTVLGSNFAPTGDTSHSLSLTTQVPCPAPNMVWLAQAQVGGTLAFGSPPIDSLMTSNTYTENNTLFFGNNIRGEGWTSSGENAVNQGLPLHTSITFTFDSSIPMAKEIMAVCIAGTEVDSAEGAMGSGSLGPGTPLSGVAIRPNIVPTRQNRFGNIVIVMTIVSGGSGKIWTESCGYSTLVSTTLSAVAPVDDGSNVLYVSYAVVGDQIPVVVNTPPPYCATTSATAPSWATNYMPYRLQTCGLNTAGAGSC